MSPVSAGGRRNVQGLPKHYARVAWSPVLVISGFMRRLDMPDPENADPDIQRKTELDLEAEQRTRLLDAFSMIETYDEREAIIRACEKSAKLDS